MPDFLSQPRFKGAVLLDQTTADSRYIGAPEKGAASGVAPLNSAREIPSEHLPQLYITEPFVVGSQAEQLALTAQRGDVAIRTDQSRNYIHNGGTAGTMADWTDLAQPVVPVQSVNGQVGTVQLGAADVEAASAGSVGPGLGNLSMADAERTVYVSPTGSDSTGDGTSAAPWQTIQFAVNQSRLMFARINGTSAYKIVCKPGVYQERVIMPANLLASFSSAGAGGLWVVSETNNAADVLVSSLDTNTFEIYGNATLEHLTIENDNIAILARGTPGNFVMVKNCVLRCASTSNGSSGALYVQCGRIQSYDNESVSGRLFDIGLRARDAAVIGKRGRQPAGATANEEQAVGGMIR